MGRDVRHIGDGRRLHPAAEHAVDHASPEQREKGDGDVDFALLQREQPGEQQERDGGAGKTRENHGTPAPFVGQPPPARRGEQKQHRGRRNDRADLEFGQADAAAEQTHCREDRRISHHHDEDGEKNDCRCHRTMLADSPVCGEMTIHCPVLQLRINRQAGPPGQPPRHQRSSGWYRRRCVRDPISRSRHPRRPAMSAACVR